MDLPDVNILVYAANRLDTRHEVSRAWLDAALDGPQPFGLSELVLSGFMRVATVAGSTLQPDAPRLAREFTRRLWESPMSMALRPGSRHFEIFLELCESLDLRGNHIPDAYHAALAIEWGCTFVTADRGFGRFPGLDWRLLE